jgi:hypothetical protein
MISKSNTVD